MFNNHQFGYGSVRQVLATVISNFHGYDSAEKAKRILHRVMRKQNYLIKGCIALYTLQQKAGKSAPNF